MNNDPTTWADVGMLGVWFGGIIAFTIAYGWAMRD